MASNLNKILKALTPVTRTGLFTIFIVLLIIIPHSEVFAQDEHKGEKKENVLLHPHKFYHKFFPNLRIKRKPPDSTFIKMYPNYLSVGMHVLSPAIGVDIKSGKNASDGLSEASEFRTNISDILGFSASYRFVSAGFAFLLPSGMNMHTGYAPSRYRSATIKYNGAADALQFKYVRIQGFTDISHADPYDTSSPYTKRPDMLNKEFQFEGIHNFSWKKYSYIAPLTFSQRQVKSRAGLLLKMGLYYNQLSSDSTLVSKERQMYYDDFSDITAIRSLSIRFAPGLGGNLVVLRKFYLSAVAFASPDLYFYKFLKNSEDKAGGKHKFAFVWEGKVGIGYQSERLYAGLRYEIERRASVLGNISYNTNYSYTGIELGYRFAAPNSLKKVYKKTMPPGM